MRIIISKRISLSGLLLIAYIFSIANSLKTSDLCTSYQTKCSRLKNNKTIKCEQSKCEGEWNIQCGSGLCSRNL